MWFSCLFDKKLGTHLHFDKLLLSPPRTSGPWSSPDLPILYHCQHNLKGEARDWGYTVSRYLSWIMASITLTIWGGSWAGGTELVTWITRDWVGHVEIHQLKKCHKLAVSSNDFIFIGIFLDQKVWDSSLVLHGQWKSVSFLIILSDEEAVIWDLVESPYCILLWDPAVIPCLSLQFSWKTRLKCVSRLEGGSWRDVNMVTTINTTAKSTERDITYWTESLF